MNTEKRTIFEGDNLDIDKKQAVKVGIPTETYHNPTTKL
jgi:hypothetical protein